MWPLTFIYGSKVIQTQRKGGSLRYHAVLCWKGPPLGLRSIYGTTKPNQRNTLELRSQQTFKRKLGGSSLMSSGFGCSQIQCDLTLLAIYTQWPISIERVSLFINKLWLAFVTCNEKQLTLKKCSR